MTLIARAPRLKTQVFALTDTYTPQSNWQFFSGYLKRHQWSYGCGVAVLAITNLLAVSIPERIGEAIDLLQTPAENATEFKWVVGGIVVLALAMMLARTASRMLFFNPGRAVEKELKDESFAKLTQLPEGFYRQHSTGGLISIVNNDVNGIRALAGVVMLQIFNIFFALSLTPIKMWQLSPQLTLYCLFPVVATFLLCHGAIGRMRQLMKTRMEELQALSTRSVELLSGFDVIRSNRVHGWAQRQFDQDNQQLLQRSLQLARIRTLILPVLGYTDRIMKVIILAVGGFAVIDAQLSLGDLVAFLAYATLFAMPFFSLAMIFSSFQNGWASVESLRRVLDQQPPQKNTRHLPQPQRQALFSSAIRVCGLNYTYPGESRAALKDLHFEIKPGEVVGVLGQVGSGKSTLVNCLNGYLDVPAATVFIDECDIAEMSNRDLRSVVRTVTQEAFLFSDTVSGNVLFGGASDRDIDDVLRQSRMYDEVHKFPLGKDTLVGEKGMLLSGGQKQRLSLARALFTPCKLLILDNVLSAVDNDTETYLLQQIFNHQGIGSLLIVSHRASVLEKVDRVLVLQDGEICARGTHEELMVSSEFYRHTWELQRDQDQQVALS